MTKTAHEIATEQQAWEDADNKNKGNQNFVELGTNPVKLCFLGPPVVEEQAYVKENTGADRFQPWDPEKYPGQTPMVNNHFHVFDVNEERVRTLRLKQKHYRELMKKREKWGYARFTERVIDLCINEKGHIEIEFTNFLDDGFELPPKSEWPEIKVDERLPA